MTQETTKKLTRKRVRKPPDDRPPIKEHIRWDTAAVGEIIRVWNDRIRVQATKPLAPGQRKEAKITASGTTFRMKALRLGMEDGRLVLEARLIDATRAVLDEFAALYQSLQRAPQETTDPSQEGTAG